MSERDRLVEFMHRRNEFDYDACDHGTYTGPLHPQEYKMCERQAAAILAEFMPEHDERVKAEAWDESRDASGHLVYQADHYETKWTQDVVNPYRREA